MPRKVYKMRDVIDAVVDEGSFFEMGRGWGKSIITGFARLDGWPVAVFAEDPYVYGGAWTADASRKVTRFIDLASTFHLPLIHLEDCPGFLIGKESEEDATIRFGSAALAALGQSASPFCARGDPQGVRRGRCGQQQARGRPTSATRGRRATGARCPSKAGSRWRTGPSWRASRATRSRTEIDRIRDRLNRFRSPFRSAEVFEIEDVIDPRDTRASPVPLGEPGRRRPASPVARP